MDLAERIQVLNGDVANLEDRVERLEEALGEISNRAGNFMDPDAGEWMPSIYKLSCEALGIDPWPMLERNGWSRDKLTVSFSNGDRQ